jgi:hypothetical protein
MHKLILIFFQSSQKIVDNMLYKIHIKFKLNT